MRRGSRCLAVVLRLTPAAAHAALPPAMQRTYDVLVALEALRDADRVPQNASVEVMRVVPYDARKFFFSVQKHVTSWRQHPSFTMRQARIGADRRAPSNPLRRRERGETRRVVHTQCERECNAFNGTLAAILDAAEQKAIVDIVGGASTAENGYFIGAYQRTTQDDKKGWCWTAASTPHVRYSSWDDGQPDAARNSNAIEHPPQEMITTGLGSHLPEGLFTPGAARGE